MPFGYVVDRLLFAQRLQRYFTFEFSGEFTSFFHRLLVSYFFLATCPTLRDQLKQLPQSRARQGVYPKQRPQERT